MSNNAIIYNCSLTWNYVVQYQCYCEPCCSNHLLCILAMSGISGHTALVIWWALQIFFYRNHSLGRPGQCSHHPLCQDRNLFLVHCITHYIMVYFSILYYTRGIFFISSNPKAIVIGQITRCSESHTRIDYQSDSNKVIRKPQKIIFSGRKQAKQAGAELCQAQQS